MLRSEQGIGGGALVGVLYEKLIWQVQDSGDLGRVGFEVILVTASRVLEDFICTYNF